MGYRLDNPQFDGVAPVIVPDDGVTTSWRDAKKSLRQWYLDEVRKLRVVTEKTYFNEEENDNDGR